MKRFLFLTIAVAGFFAGVGQLPTVAARDYFYERRVPWGTGPTVVRPGAQFALLEGEGTSSQNDQVALELLALGKNGDTIARARRQVLEILQQGNACAAWFQKADPDPADVFRSLHYELEVSEPSYIYGIKDSKRGQLYRHPWGARSMENSGRDSIILLNANGPFFNLASLVMERNPKGMVALPSGYRLLMVSSYKGNTPAAQITILLHELGHITGRLPVDDDSWDGSSSRNTAEMLRHCKSEIHGLTHNSSKGGD